MNAEYFLLEASKNKTMGMHWFKTTMFALMFPTIIFMFVMLIEFRISGSEDRIIRWFSESLLFVLGIAVVLFLISFFVIEKTSRKSSEREAMLTYLEWRYTETKSNLFTVADELVHNENADKVLCEQQIVALVKTLAHINDAIKELEK